MQLDADTVLVVGDTHGNTPWWVNVVVPLAERLGVDAIFQVGDFGWWPHGDDFVGAVQASPVPVWFIDGNHEHHLDLHTAVAHARSDTAATDPCAPVHLSGALHYIPRGGRVSVGGLVVAGVGGARSIDAAYRSLGIDWFLEESLDVTDIARACAGGPADVLVAHDAPAGWTIPGLLLDHELSPAWRAARPACEEHRHRLRQVYEALTPRVVIHGHYHSAYFQTVVEPWGTVDVHGLDCDASDYPFAVLDATSDGPRVRHIHWR